MIFMDAQFCLLNLHLLYSLLVFFVCLGMKKICCKYGTYKHSGLKVKTTMHHTVIHHMLESHHCPFGTAEAPYGFNRAKLKNPIQGHTKIPLFIQCSIHWRLCLVSFQKCTGPLCLSMQTVYSVFSHTLS